MPSLCAAPAAAWMPAVAAVGGRNHFAAALAPHLDDAVDRRRRQVGPVAEDYDRGGHRWA